MKLKDLDYDLPTGQIAQRPLDRRDGARLLVLDRESGSYQDRQFADFPALLRGDELLVFNNTRVIPARLLGRRATARRAAFGDSTGSKNDEPEIVEVFLTRNLLNDEWKALVRPGKKVRVGERVLFGEGILEAEIVGHGERGVRTLRFISHSSDSVAHHLERFGHVPLPPYIERSDDETDRERYQTVFAKNPGAIAAPTAGLHFTEETLRQIRERGCELCEITLHVGLGTFQPIRGETLEGHKMHEESYEISEDTVTKISAAYKAGRKILAVGTTSVRALEAAALRASEENSERVVLPGRAEARLFITPGFRFRLVDALLTNFHLPQSTLLALVCAFAGRDKVMAAYTHAVEAGYRFYSYGDCMLLG
ncbi:MAG TPA: tRNA preQ1(34) S-adenosylmethionine ribosyltransferase-isomerase QueA [Candidatus Eremiobacteraceae bacterium]|nr:tRNA preQ1(34) S-adenosylmethionine ribosyltransferase-isomerase QueA [Candidatus Eremiobacteraceae bacterium]